ncbi:MAG: transposase [Planctomycetes bacterium]|nr:transposase [Planctomycetota bacterium]
MWRQDTESLIRGIENAFHHFGGVPKTLVPDNLKAAVLEHDWCDPTITPKFEAFARHYGVAVLPTKPRTPRHKGVERCVAPAQDNALKRQAIRFARRAERAPARLGRRKSQISASTAPRGSR